MLPNYPRLILKVELGSHLIQSEKYLLLKFMWITQLNLLVKSNTKNWLPQKISFLRLFEHDLCSLKAMHEITHENKC